jgi:hypothetical protein
MMAMAYKNTFCNLGAHAAAERPLVLSFARVPRILALQTLPVGRKNDNQPFFAFSPVETNMLAASTLMSCG